ncbi:hypothetical protein CALCODRAFT_417909, partial [Calocera cornea HHB12733]
LNSLNTNGVPPHTLQLKPGAVCTLMRNFSVKKRLVKNARVVVETLNHHFVQIHVLATNGHLDPELHCIPRIRFSFQPQHSSWTVLRTQLPLRLAYATTFNSCQGLTLDRTVLDCRTDVFAHGQLYTALTRVRTQQDSIVLLGEETDEVSVANIQDELLMLPHNI